jgi:ABC-type lipoprotein export system ATPase subunit
VLVTHDEDVALHAGRVIRVRDGAIVRDEVNTTPLDGAQPQSTAEAKRNREPETMLG